MMAEHENLSAPWTPKSGMSSFRSVAAGDHAVVDELLFKVNSPMKLFDAAPLNPAPQADFRSPGRPAKRAKAPPASPGTAMILHAARVIEVGEVGIGLGSPGTTMLSEFDSSPSSFHAQIMGGPFLAASSPPSPARTPSRLLFSPKSEPRNQHRGFGISPRSGMITSYDGLLNDAQSGGHGDPIGSIWKHSNAERRKNANSTARRPLLQPTTPAGKENAEENSPVPLPQQTPTYTPSPRVARKSSSQRSGGSSSKSSKGSDGPRKDRKTYSTAGRPRVRGEYKCGKCGFYPKKSRHDCDEVKAKAAAGQSVQSQVEEFKANEKRNKGQNRSPSGTGTMLFEDGEERDDDGVAPLRLDLGSPN